MSTITLTTIDGEKIECEFQGPDEGPAGGVVLLHEYWGLNAHIRGLASRLARSGFFVLAPDLFDGQVATDPKVANELMTRLNTESAMKIVEAAAIHLRGVPGCNKKVGVMGFCMGGAMAFASACHVPALRAVVPFYGIPAAEKVNYANVTAAIQAHFAADDRWATKEKAEAIKATLAERKIPMDLFVYDAAHAFMNDARPEVYDPAAATIAWSRAVEFLATHLA